MYREYNELPLGFSMLFGYDLATKEYLDRLPKDVWQKASPHKFQIDSLEENINHAAEPVDRY